jgi:hypothetical protein
METGIAYSPDSIDPEYNIGFGVQVGGGAPASASVSGGVSNAAGATPGCLTCGGGIMGLSWPIIILVIAVLVLALRK